MYFGLMERKVTHFLLEQMIKGIRRKHLYQRRAISVTISSDQYLLDKHGDKAHEPDNAFTPPAFNTMMMGITGSLIGVLLPSYEWLSVLPELHDRGNHYYTDSAPS
jgi:hypothetical protein